MDTKPKIRVVDVPVTASAAETELLLNEPCDDGYSLNRLSTGQLPDGIGTRAFYKIRIRPERTTDGEE